MDFAVAHGRHRGERHVERVKRGIAGDEDEAGGADGERDEDGGNQEQEAARQSAHRGSPSIAGGEGRLWRYRRIERFAIRAGGSGGGNKWLLSTGSRARVPTGSPKTIR